MVELSNNLRRQGIIVLSVCLLAVLFSGYAGAAYANPYNMEFINIALAVNDTALCTNSATIEYKIRQHLMELNAPVSCTLNSSSAETFASYNVTLAVDPILGSAKVAAIRDLGGSLLLLDDAIIDYNNTDDINITSNLSSEFSEIKVIDNATNARGYPVNATISVSGYYMIPNYSDFTVSFEETDNNISVVVSKNYSSGANIVLAGFIPTNSDDPFHIWRIIEKSIFWQTDIFDRLSVINASSDALIISDPRGTDRLTALETNIYEWLQPEIGSSLTLVPVSEATFRGYSVTQRVIVLDYNKVTTMLPDWRAEGKDLFLIHAGVKDLEYLFDANVTGYADNENINNLCNWSDQWDDMIVSNKPGEITYGFAVNSHIDTQSANTRYLANITDDNITVLVKNVSGEAVLLYYSSVNSTNQTNLSSDIIAYGINPIASTVYGNLLKERSYDWLTDNLNITGITARRFVIPIYGGGDGPIDQEDAIYNRLIENYGAINVSKVNLSMINITDYTQTELVIVHDKGKVTSLIPQWNQSQKIFYVYEGVDEASYYYSGNTTALGSVGCTKYISIKKANATEITYGYVPTATIQSQSECVFKTNASLFTQLVQTGISCSAYAGVDTVSIFGDSLLSYYNNSNGSFKTAAYGFDPDGAIYHDWKLFDRGIEWLLGTLNITGLDTADVVMTVYNNGNLTSEETTYKSRLDGLQNTSNISHTEIEISIITVSNYSNTSVAVIPNPGLTGQYYKTGFLDNGIGLLLPRGSMYRFYADYIGGGVLLTSENWAGTGIISTANSNHTYPTYGYPNRAKVVVCTNCGSGNSIGLTWGSLPANYNGMLEADPTEVGGAQSRYTLITNNVTFSAKLMLMGFHPNTHHGLILFDRSIMWLLDSLNVTGKKTKDIVLVVYNEDNLSLAESTVQGWINNTWGQARYSTLDISDVMASELWGTSRYVITRKDIITGVVNYWHNLSNGIIFLGESVNDTAIALDVASIGGIDYLGDEYADMLNGTIANSHYIVGNLTASSVWELATSFDGAYGIRNLNSSLFSSLVTHSNCVGTCPEVMLAAHQSNVGNMSMIGINPDDATNTTRDWILNAIEWVSETDTIPPVVNVINITPQEFANNVTVNILANVTDNRCLGNSCLSVYNVTLNYTTNYSNTSAWQIATFTRWNNITDYWELTLDPLYNMTYMIYNIITVDTTGNTNDTLFYYYGIADDTTPSVYNISFTPFMPNITEDVSVHFNSDKFVNASLYYRVYNTSTIWIQNIVDYFTPVHSINTGTHNTNIYEYWITACDFSQNCINETNNDQYYLFCIDPGCERIAPNITSSTPANSTVFHRNITYMQINITTSKWSECRFSNSSGADFENMSAFNNTRSTNHSMTLDLVNNTNNMYVKCKDMLGNKNTLDYHLYYFVDIDPPNINLARPVDQFVNNGSIVYFNYTAYDNVDLLRCSLYLNISDWSENRTDWTVLNASSNSFKVSLDTFNYTWNIRCWDTVNNTAFAATNYSVYVDVIAPINVFGSEECPLDTDAAGNKFCYPADVAIGVTRTTLYDGFEVTDIVNWTVVDYGSGVVDTTTTESASGNYSLYTRTTNTWDYAYVTRNITFEYPYIIDYWIFMPASQLNIAGAGGLYIMQYQDPDNAEIEIMFKDNDTSFDVKENGVWTYDVANISPGSWYNIKVSMINETNFRLYINETYYGTFNQSSSAIPNSIALGEVENDSGGGTAYFDYVKIVGPMMHVADTDNWRIQILDMNGSYISTIGGEEDVNGKFNYPRGIDVSDMGYIYVADSLNDSIQIFFPNGTLKSRISNFNNPGDVVVDYNNWIYVADTDNNVVKVYNASEEYNKTIGNIILNAPESLDVYNSQIYVANTGNNTVDIFMENGSLNYTIDYNFSQPSDVLVDLNGMIHVVDLGNHQIKVFYPNGSHYQSFGNFSTSFWGKFDEPAGIDTNLGFAYVADKNNNRIQVFSLFYNRIIPFSLANPLTANYTIYNLSDPQGLFIHNNGLLYVADKSNDTIMVYSSGDLNTTITGEVPLYNPSDVAVDGAQKIYVADTFNDSITVIYHNGTYFGKITGFNKPQGVAVDSSGWVYVADTNNNSISVFYPNWSLSHTFGSNGTDPGQFNTPMDIAVDSESMIYVADRRNHRIQKFNKNGDFVMQIGNTSDFGNATGQFDNPEGVYVDYNGLIFVADTYNDRIQIFNSNGSFNFTFTGNNTLNAPEGVSVDYNGMIYVADTNNSQIHAFNGWPIREYIPPTISDLSPQTGSSLRPYTTSTTVNVTTDHMSVCKISNSSGVAFEDMVDNFNFTYYYNHSVTLTGLEDNTSYAYYIRCINMWDFNTTEDYVILFNVSTPNIVLNEFMPNPASGPQWIELYNRGDTGVNLTNWMITYNDSFTSTNYTINASIDFRDYLVLYGNTTTIQLNESQGNIYLLDRDNTTADNMSYYAGNFNITWSEIPLNYTLGRSQDGVENWTYFSNATIGASNEGAVTVSVSLGLGWNLMSIPVNI